MQAFKFYVDYVIMDNYSNDFTSEELPFTAEGDSYEEARSKALEFAQSIARCYNDSDYETFYFRITKA